MSSVSVDIREAAVGIIILNLLLPKKQIQRIQSDSQ